MGALEILKVKSQNKIILKNIYGKDRYPGTLPSVNSMKHFKVIDTKVQKTKLILYTFSFSF